MKPIAKRLFSVAFVFVTVWAGQAAAAPTTQDVVNGVSQASYSGYLDNHLYTHLGENRMFSNSGGSDRHDAARDNILSLLSGFGLSAELQSGTHGGYAYSNVVATLPGTKTPEAVYVIGAHYDASNSSDPGTGAGETPGAPGADDNASGVAAVLEAARVMSGYEFESTIVFAAFDREEQGLHGSYGWVDSNPAAQVAGMISADMIAYNPAGEHHGKAWIYYAQDNSAITSALAASMDSYADIEATVAQMGRSDHQPFDEAGFDACLLIEHGWSENPHYHKWSDSVDTQGYIDYAYATQMTQGLVGYLSDAAVVTPEPGTMSLLLAGGLCMLARRRRRRA